MSESSATTGGLGEALAEITTALVGLHCLPRAPRQLCPLFFVYFPIDVSVFEHREHQPDLSVRSINSYHQTDVKPVRFALPRTVFVG